jgi:predicted SAM-dependent methyltransferase
MKIVRRADGAACLNVGCGETFFADWTNIDIVARAGVEQHDIRDPLPFDDSSFVAVYSSHVLEHLTTTAGRSFVHEMFRVLEPGGVCRVVVPDLETICREYIRCLDAAIADPTKEHRQRYDWIVLELLDQMVRDRPGGIMMETLRSGDFDESFVKARNGDQFAACYSEARSARPDVGGLTQRAKHALSKAITRAQDPRESGEAHKWMYDRYSLRRLLSESGFVDGRVVRFDESAIPRWSSHNLDASQSRDRPRKPDSLFFECRKPVG